MPGGFFGRWPTNWRDVIADLTAFYHWGPHDAWGLSWFGDGGLAWWNEQAKRMSKD